MRLLVAEKTSLLNSKILSSSSVVPQVMYIGGITVKGKKFFPAVVNLITPLFSNRPPALTVILPPMVMIIDRGIRYDHDSVNGQVIDRKGALINGQSTTYIHDHALTGNRRCRTSSRRGPGSAYTVTVASVQMNC